MNQIPISVAVLFWGGFLALDALALLFVLGSKAVLMMKAGRYSILSAWAAVINLTLAVVDYRLNHHFVLHLCFAGYFAAAARFRVWTERSQQ